MTKEPNILLQHIHESAEWIERHISGISREQFLASVQVQGAVMRRLEIIGEAVKNLSDDFKEEYSDIPWRKIAGMRDILIHEYFGVDAELVWITATKDIPEFKKAIQMLLNE